MDPSLFATLSAFAEASFVVVTRAAVTAAVPFTKFRREKTFSSLTGHLNIFLRFRIGKGMASVVCGFKHLFHFF